MLRHKHLTALVISISLLLGLTSLTSAKTTLIHWQHTQTARDEMVRDLAAEFMALHPDVEIELQSFPLAEYLDKVVVALASGSGPDTLQVRNTWIPWLSQSGLLSPLNEDVINAQTIERLFIPGAINKFKHSGKYYALPTDAQTIVMFYQPYLFEQVGLNSAKPPQTWDEMIAAARKIHRRNTDNKTEVMGAATGGYGPVLLTLMIQAGANLFDTNTQLPVFNTPQALRGLKFATDMVTEWGVEDQSFGSRWTAFRNEKLGMVLAHPAMKGSFLSTHPDLQFSIREIPAPEAGGSQVSLLTNWALAVSNPSKSAIATEWLLFLQSSDAQARWLEKTGELPTRWDVIRDPKYQRDLDTQSIMYSLTRGVGIPWLNDAIIDSLVNQAWNSVARSQTSIQAAIENLHQQAVVEEQRVRAERL
jgi:multiple sugar transport system substrate-binding protein